jgi:phosphoribosylformylglycinamidine cyclo-ligase
LHSQNLLKGAAHVTGGGIEGNTGRIVPEGLVANVDYAGWERPEIFTMIKELGSVPEDDMRKTFNLGIGLVFVVARQAADQVVDQLKQQGEEPVVMGTIETAG